MGKRGPKSKLYYPEDKATHEWLHSHKTSTRHTYALHWKYFMEFTGLNGDQILESRKEDKEFTWEKKVIEFKTWMIKEKGQAEKSAVTATATVRGFFDYHRMPLRFRRTEKVILHEARAKHEDYRFSREDLKRMCDFANLEEKYVITAGKSFGLRAGDFMRITRGDLEPYLDRPVPISIGEFTTQKEGVTAHPFIDADAIDVIKLMIEKMDREGRTKPTDRILPYSHEIQLSRIVRRLADKAGIKYGNKRVRFHNLRKYLIDRLASHMSESKWKQIIGKKISESAYVSVDNLRADYERAMQDTCFIRSIGETDVAKQARLESLKAFAKLVGFSERELKELFAPRMRSTIAHGFGGGRVFMTKLEPLTIDEKIELLEEAIKEKRQQHNSGQEDCPNGVHCGEFEQIHEAELLTYLRSGWQIVHKLTNGEVIVKR